MKENNNLEEDSIDIIALLKTIWIEKKLIVKVTVSFFIIGCIVAILSPVVYTSETTFVPQVSEDQMSTSKSSLGSLASLAGINLNEGAINSSDSYLSPLLYSKLAESEEFALNIINEEIINSNGNKLTVKEYLLSNESLFNFNSIEFIKKYTIELFLNNETEKNSSDVFKGFNFISEEDFNLITNFKEKFTIELNENEGFIKVLARDKSAFISTQLVQIITKNLQSKIIKLRTNKIKERLEYSKEQYELKQTEFDFLQKKLAEFKDSNKNISTARFMSELQKLESEYQLQQNILINLASEFNNNKIKLNKDTPIFSVIDEVSVPNERSKPIRSLLVIISIIIGFVLSISFVLGKEPIINLVKEIKD
jgi:LPS O-antigen subunit length determinant protein (WzzB/FepE family)